MMRIRTGRTLQGLRRAAACALLVAGCAGTPPARSFFGSESPSGAHAPGAAAAGAWKGVFADGSTRTGLYRQYLTVKLINRGDALIPLSAVADRYEVNTAEGHPIQITPEFFTYPSRLEPRGEATVHFRLPETLPPERILQVVVTLDMGRTKVVLTPLPTATPSTPPPSLTRTPPQEPVWRGFQEPLPPTEAPPLAIETPVPPAPAAQVEQKLQMAASHVPVTVEFQQELGRALRVTLGWDGQGDPVVLDAGDRRLFQVAPGPHILQFATQLPPIATTSGQIPLTLALGTSVRVLVEATARPAGVDVRARAWRGAQLLMDKRFVPK